VNVDVVPIEKKSIFEKIVKKCNEYHSYECTIQMKYGPRKKTLKVPIGIDENTTFESICKKLNKANPLIEGEDIEFENDEKKKYDQSLYNTSFKELNIRPEVLKSSYSYRDSLIRGNSLISVGK
jgi:hypothetical protein